MRKLRKLRYGQLGTDVYKRQGLVREGRYMIPYLPDGVYADLRTASNIEVLY